MARILFYSPFNQRSRDTESLMIAFHNQGHQVISLTQQEGFVINDFLRSKGVAAYSYIPTGKRSGWWYYLRLLFFFIRFCWKQNIQIVYSHLEPANFVASIGQYFIRAKTFLCRHHIDEGQLYRFDQDLYYKITYCLARHIIVVSDHARKYMIEKERIPSRKIVHINLAYDFSLYGSPDAKMIEQIKNEYQAQIRLVSACRLTAYKRPDLIIEVVKELVGCGLDVKLVMLGKGEMEQELVQRINELDLQQRVFMPGYVSNVLDYLGAADFFLHPSILDSSCVAVKEAALVSLPVIVCEGVGDFDDYVRHMKNGFVVNRDAYVTEATEIILQNFHNKNLLRNIGKNLNHEVLRLFSVGNIIGQYDALNTTR
ncbi:MAG: glycosyltransferase [Cyclobacteriaceae bacterium]|nr:glycosyltransferase [Cyclobacteriaceae bacterium]